jgi:serine/threonine protein kinase
MSDYQEAIQNPNTCFSDTELQQGTPVLNNLGLPKPISGGFACVYQLLCGSRYYAVRCFLTKQLEQEKRYKVISDYLSKIKLPYMVGFEFLSQGIKVNGQWYPILKMEWIDGDPLNIYLEKNIYKKTKLKAIAANFLSLLEDLHKHQIAHGDLQHGNILVANDQLRLIDYDGLYVPGLEAIPSKEYGHRNYQHPSRSDKDFGPWLDNFSAWVIYASLLALSMDPNLWGQLKAGDEFLIFRKEDFLNPNQSLVFKRFEQGALAPLKFYANQLKCLLDLKDLSSIPKVDTKKNFAGKNQNQCQSQSQNKNQIQSDLYQGLPSWIQDYYVINTEITSIKDKIVIQEPSLLLDSRVINLPIKFTNLVTERIVTAGWFLGFLSILACRINEVIDLINFYCICTVWSLALVILFKQKYRKRSEFMSKKRIILGLRELEAEISNLKENVENYKNEKKKIVEEKTEKFNRILEKQKDIDLMEKSELDKCNKTYNLQIRGLNNKIKNVMLTEKQRTLLENEIKQLTLEQPQILAEVRVKHLNNKRTLLKQFATIKSYYDQKIQSLDALINEENNKVLVKEENYKNVKKYLIENRNINFFHYLKQSLLFMS